MNSARFLKYVQPVFDIMYESVNKNLQENNDQRKSNAFFGCNVYGVFGAEAFFREYQTSMMEFFDKQLTAFSL